MTKFQFLDYTGLILYDQMISQEYDDKIAEAIKTAIKSVSLSSDGYTIYFYTTATPSSVNEAAFNIPLPEPVDISGKIDKVPDATIGDIAVLKADGGIVDSGKKVSDFATAQQGQNADAAKDIAENNLTAINKINDPNTGILATSKSYTDSSISALHITDYATLAYVDEQLSKIYTKTEIDATIKGVKDTISDLSKYVGTIPASAISKDVVSYISEVANKVIENGYDDTELRDRITTVEGKVNVLNGDGEGSVKKQVSDAVASIVSDAPEAFDTLKEISDWISSHSTDAASMNSQIQTNKTDIAKLVTLIGKLPEDANSTTVIGYIKEYVGQVFGGIDWSIYAKQADLESAVQRISQNETDISVIKTALADGGTISNAIKEALTIAKNAKQTADSLKTLVGTLPTEGTQATTIVGYIDEKTNINTSKIDAIDERLTDVESDVNTLKTTVTDHSSKLDSILDTTTGILAQSKGYTDTEVSTALRSAKDYTDILKNGTVAQNSAAITKNSQDIADLQELVGDGFEPIELTKIRSLFNSESGI